MATTPENMQTIENAVYSAISACLDVAAKETIEFSPEYYTFHLPNGVQKIDFPKNTYVDVKFRLNYGSLMRIRENYDKIHPQKVVVVVQGEDEGFIPQYARFFPGRDIIVRSYNTLKQYIDSVTKEENIVENPIVEEKYQIEKETSIHSKLKEAIQNNKVSIFLGAGVSASAGVVTWNSLLEQLCIKKGIAKIDNDIDSVIKGRYIVGEYKDDKNNISDDFYTDIRNILYAHTHSSNLIQSIASLILKSDIESVISYNYDNLVENEIRNNNKSCHPIYNKDMPKGKNVLYIYHVHGFVGSNEDEKSSIVLGEQEYHKIFQESYNWGNVEQLHALCRSTCLFIGLSMNDPNLRRLIDISIEGSDVEPIHYAFLRRIEYNIPFTEKIMRGFGINCVWYDNFDELPQLLDSLITN